MKINLYPSKNFELYQDYIEFARSDSFDELDLEK